LGQSGIEAKKKVLGPRDFRPAGTRDRKGNRTRSGIGGGPRARFGPHVEARPLGQLRFQAFRGPLRPHQQRVSGTGRGLLHHGDEGTGFWRIGDGRRDPQRISEVGGRRGWADGAGTPRDACRNKTKYCFARSELSAISNLGGFWPCRFTTFLLPRGTSPPRGDWLGRGPDSQTAHGN